MHRQHYSLSISKSGSAACSCCRPALVTLVQRDSTSRISCRCVAAMTGRQASVRTSPQVNRCRPNTSAQATQATQAATQADDNAVVLAVQATSCSGGSAWQPKSPFRLDNWATSGSGFSRILDRNSNTMQLRCNSTGWAPHYARDSGGGGERKSGKRRLATAESGLRMR